MRMLLRLLLLALVAAAAAAAAAAAVGGGAHATTARSSGLPPKWNMSGMTYTGGRYCPSVAVGSAASNASMDHLQTTGADWVSIVVTEYHDK
jgi:hypothetical protein